MSTPELTWIAAHMPGEREMCQHVDDVMAAHTEWDSPHQFTLLSWDGQKLVPVHAAMVDPALHPVHYSSALRRFVIACVMMRRRESPTAPEVVAAALQFEAYGVATSNGRLLPEERAAFARREAHTLPHRQESVWVYAADVAGRSWCASKVRGFDGAPDVVGRAGEPRGSAAGSFPDMVHDCVSVVPRLYLKDTSFWTAGGSTPPKGGMP